MKEGILIKLGLNAVVEKC